MKRRIFALALAMGMFAGCAPKEKPPEKTDGDVSQGISSGTDSGAVSQPQEYEEVTIYLPKESADGIEQFKVQVPKSDQMAATLVQTLETEKALPAGSDVNEWTLENKKLTVDLNAAFAEGILQMGTAGETMAMDALVNTLWMYYQPEQIILTAEGKQIESGHNIYTEPFAPPFEFSYDEDQS